MPRKRVDRASPALRHRDALDAAGDLADVMEAALDRALSQIQRGSVGSRRPRGRGAALSTLDQLTVMFYAAGYGESVKAIARTLGMHKRTVRRVLAMPIYAKFHERVMLEVLDGVFSSRGRW